MSVEVRARRDHYGLRLQFSRRTLLRRGTDNSEEAIAKSRLNGELSLPLKHDDIVARSKQNGWKQLSYSLSYLWTTSDLSTQHHSRQP